MKINKMTGYDLSGKRVLIREDLNVPVQDGVVTSDARIRAALPTIRLALEQGARVLVMSHLGRPEEGEYSEAASLAPVAKRIGELLGVPVALKRDWLERRRSLAGHGRTAGERALQQRREEGRRRSGQENGVAVRHLRHGCVRYCAPRRGEHARRGEVRPIACAGPLLVNELTALETALDNPARPLIAIVAGSKVSTKLTVLESLLAKVDGLIVGGGIANTFLAALGFTRRQVAVRTGHVRHLQAAVRAVEEARHRNSDADRRRRRPRVFGQGRGRRQAGRHRVRRRDDPRRRSGYVRAPRRGARLRRYHRLERPDRRVRVRAVRRGNARARQRDRAQQGVLARRRRRHARRDRKVPASRRASPIFRPAAAPSSNSSRARSSPPSKFSSSARHERAAATDQDRRHARPRDRRSDGARLLRARRRRRGATQFLSWPSRRSCAASRAHARGRSQGAGRYIGVLGDLQGPKIRIDRFAGGPVQFADGATFTLDASLAADAGTRRRSASPTRSCRRTCSSTTCCCSTTGRSACRWRGSTVRASTPECSSAASSATTRASIARAAVCRPAR